MAGLDYWREYFGSANADIFEIIEKAIMTAASDYPNEFRIKRDGIAQTLFSCKLVKCSGCDKLELAVPERDEGVKYNKSKLVDVDGNGSKGSSKAISSCRNDSYGEAEALTDEIEEETQIFDEVMRIKEIIDNSPDESPSVLCNSLRKLQLMALSVQTLKATEIGKSVNGLRKHASKGVCQIARALIDVWKDMVDEWMNATTKTNVSEATPESTNPCVVDEEGGLPSPPLDDLAFLNPHTMSLELSEFFDGMDDSGNVADPGNRREFNNGGKPLNEATKLPKKQSTAVKPTKPPVHMKSNTERKLQQASRPKASSVKEKLEATKRKLQERYRQAEDAKRQRTVQVMEPNDVPKQGRPGSRQWSNGRC